MKQTLNIPYSITAIALAIILLGSSAWAQSNHIYRCPNNEYTNDSKAVARGCKPVEGGNVTIVQTGNSPYRERNERVASSGNSRSSSAAINPPTVRPAVASSTEQQRERDADSRRILEEELRKAQEKFTLQSKEYNGGLPEKRGDEARNYQKYLDRVAEMKADLSRTENDIAGLKREIGRLPATSM